MKNSVGRLSWGAWRAHRSHGYQLKEYAVTYVTILTLTVAIERRFLRTWYGLWARPPGTSREEQLSDSLCVKVLIKDIWLVGTTERLLSVK